MKALLTTSALIALTAAPAFAQTATTESTIFMTQSEEAAVGAELSATSLIGSRVYVAETAPAEAVDGPSGDWEDIGEIGDILLSRDGALDAVVLDIGGFLGIGERHVAINMDQLAFVNDNLTDSYFLVVQTTREALEGAPEIDIAKVGAWAVANETAAMDGAANPEVAAEETAEAAESVTEEATEETAEVAEPVTEEATEETAEAVETVTEEATEETAEAATETEATDVVASDTEMERTAPEGYTYAVAEELTTEELTGARLYDTSDEMIGEISKLIIDDSGKITDAVLDVGGFLGLGEHSVAVPMEDLDIQRADADGSIRVLVGASKEELKAMEQYREDG